MALSNVFFGLPKGKSTNNHPQHLLKVFPDKDYLFIYSDTYNDFDRSTQN